LGYEPNIVMGIVKPHHVHTYEGLDGVALKVEKPPLQTSVIRLGRINVLNITCAFIIVCQ